MAIEFHCPYCTASIRVPDQFSGKRGSCPKCATKLLVPDVVPHDAATPAVERSASPTAIPVETPIPDPPPSPAPSAELPAFVATPSATTSVSRKLKRKTRQKKTAGVYGLAVPVICFLLFFGVVTAVVYLREPDLKGTLTGSQVGDMQLPPATVALSQINLRDVSTADAATSFEGAPETFLSPQMACTIGIDGDDLAITVRPGDGYQWFAVNPSANVPLADWIRSHRTELLQHRKITLAATGGELCRDKIQKQNGTPIVFDAVNYRDNFGLTAHVGAFGYVVEALVGNRVAPCAHEDNNGTLYFALPHDTSTFVLRGREIQGEKLFPGQYTVQLRDVVLPTDPASAAPDSEPLSPGGDAEMLDSEMGDSDTAEGDWDPSRREDKPVMDGAAGMDMQ